MNGLSQHRPERGRDRRERPSAGVPRPKVVRPNFFVWLAVPVLLWIGYAAYGLPHVIWSYSWTAPNSASYGDFEARTYTRCSYLGPFGLFTEYPNDGTCGWVRFHKAQDAERGTDR